MGSFTKVDILVTISLILSRFRSDTPFKSRAFYYYGTAFQENIRDSLKWLISFHVISQTKMFKLLKISIVCFYCVKSIIVFIFLNLKFIHNIVQQLHSWSINIDLHISGPTGHRMYHYTTMLQGTILEIVHFEFRTVTFLSLNGFLVFHYKIKGACFGKWKAKLPLSLDQLRIQQLPIHESKI